MRKLILVLATICFTISTFGQLSENEKLVELGKVYKDFMFRNEPTKEILEAVRNDVQLDLITSNEFIAQTITTKNSLFTQPFLTLPNDTILKQIYIIRSINLNLREENQIDNIRLIDSLKAKSIPHYDLVDNYYGMLFNAVGNKNQPFNMSKVNFQLNDYNLEDDTDKAIFFLRCMNLCGTSIWGYMNVVKPANTKEAYSYIKKFPKFNGLPYYQFNNFYFNDFELVITKDKGIQSYKSYYLDKYYDTLLSHLICLNKEGASDKEKYNLLLGSILKERNLYKYTKNKDTLEELFQEQERK
jgi:hypothetical protein